MNQNILIVAIPLNEYHSLATLALEISAIKKKKETSLNDGKGRVGRKFYLLNAYSLLNCDLLYK